MAPHRNAYLPFDGQLVNGTTQVYIYGHSIIAGTGASPTTLGCGPQIANGIKTVDSAAKVTVEGHSGYTSTQLVANLSGHAVNATYTSVCIYMGLANDFLYGVAPATSLANLQTLIGQMKAIQPAGSPTPAFVLIVEWERGDVPSPAYPWSQYVAAAYSAAAADSSVQLIDLNDIVGRAVDDHNGLIGADLIHPTNKGHALIARLVLRELMHGGRSQAFAGHAQIVAGYTLPIASVGTWTMTPSSTSFGGQLVHSDNAQNDSITWEWVGAAGTWTLRVAHRKGSNRGQYDVWIDGVLAQAAAFDGYAATASDVVDTVSGLVVSGDGKHRVSLTMATKNASSSGYTGAPSGLFLTRTGN